MPHFLHFYPGLSRDDYYRLTVEEYAVLYEAIPKEDS
jgi:hypothetical protein